MTVSTCLALLCTDDGRIKWEIKNRDKYRYVPSADLHLPQGTVTSPALSNFFFYRIDERLTRIANELGFRYSRYANDLFFSYGPDQSQESITGIRAEATDLNHAAYFLIKKVKYILRCNKLEINLDKLRIMRSGQRQIVTGILVNNELTVTRERKKNFRSLIYWCEKNELYSYMQNHISGMWFYIKMVDSNSTLLA